MATELLYRLGGESKICNKCGEAKPRTEFHKHYGKERAACKICHGKDSLEWAQKNKLKTRDRRRAYARKWASENPDKIKSYAEKHTWANRTPEAKARKSEYAKKRHLERKYGITQADWDAMYAAQGGVCAICKVPGRVGKHGKLAVDHCHSTGRVRGLLCTPCNVSIGILGETPEQWEVVLKYLRG